ncbi:hypothetical protein VPNG_07252 [Cytospora leucostoma]|uniref:Uncharacterized protein n=1 Tax=Cytospora leucostoma TaxID=1230097 RepID=A0A423WKE2_9PEZI|nr:hypothetical protein VPNG_07252 [Cytospora leucostoma]
MAGNQDLNKVSGSEQTLRSVRKEARDLASKGILIPGFRQITGFSTALLRPIVALALKSGKPEDTIVESIAKFLAHAMVPYSRIAAYEFQLNDPAEYRTAVAEGLRRAVGINSMELPAVPLLKLLESLVEKIDLNARGLAKPFGTLHRLVVDFLQMRKGHLKMPQRESLRASELKNGDYWDGLAAALLQASKWLKAHPNFVDLATVPPLGSEEMIRNMAREFAELDDELARDFWLWKEWYKVVVSIALNRQTPPKHPLDDEPDVDAPKEKKARKSRKERRAEKKKGQDDASSESSDGLADPLDVGERQGEPEDTPGYEPDDSSAGTTPSRSLSQPLCDGEKAPSHAEDSDDDGLLEPQFKAAYAIVEAILDDEFNEKRNIGRAELEVLEAQRKASTRKAEGKMDNFWKLADMFL